MKGGVNIFSYQLSVAGWESLILNKSDVTYAYFYVVHQTPFNLAMKVYLENRPPETSSTFAPCIFSE